MACFPTLPAGTACSSKDPGKEGREIEGWGWGKKPPMRATGARDAVDSARAAAARTWVWASARCEGETRNQRGAVQEGVQRTYHIRQQYSLACQRSACCARARTRAPFSLGYALSIPRREVVTLECRSFACAGPRDAHTAKPADINGHHGCGGVYHGADAAANHRAGRRSIPNGGCERGRGRRHSRAFRRQVSWLERSNSRRNQWIFSRNEFLKSPQFFGAADRRCASYHWKRDAVYYISPDRIHRVLNWRAQYTRV